jgi:predicted ferric reductase
MDFLKRYRFDLILLYLLILAPVVIWISMKPVSSRFVDSWAVLTSLGQLTALVGTILVALSMIFQVKLCRYFQFLAKPATGMNIHHYTGVYGLLLLLFHPLFLAIRYLSISLSATFNFLYTTQLTNLLGLVALLLMVVSMYTTLYLPRTFLFWKLFHQIMLVAYLGILYHTIFVYSDTSSSPALKYYLLGMLILGGLAFSLQKIQYYLRPKAIRNEDIC